MRRTVVSVLSVLVLALAACGDDDADIAVDDVETEESAPTGDEPEADETDDADDADEAGDADEPDGSDEPEDVDEADPDTGADDTADTGENGDDAAPEPDAEAVDAPCAEREGQEMESFLDVVAPVDGQRVTGEVDLVGCANVPEGTVRYQVIGEDGEPLLDDFTTAECGGPCVGAYETTVDLATAQGHETVTLAVFWDSPAGEGSEEDRTEVELTLD